jgi:hypothetical protein
MNEPEEEITPPRPHRRAATLPLGHELPRTPPPAHLDESSRVSLRLWQLLALAGTLVTATITGWRVYDGIQQNISGLRADVSALRADVNNPARLNDAARAAVRRELSTVIVECPKRIVKGEAVARCTVVMPKAEP